MVGPDHLENMREQRGGERDESDQDKVDFVRVLCGTGHQGCRDGSGPGVNFNTPTYLCTLSDRCGTIVVSDSENNTLRFICSSLSQGKRLGGSTIQEKKSHAHPHVFSLQNRAFLSPKGLCETFQGESLVVCDAGHHKLKLVHLPRKNKNAKLNLQTSTSNRYVKDEVDFTSLQTSTLAGNGRRGWADGPLLFSSFHAPHDVALNPIDGSLFIADTGNHCIRHIVRSEASGELCVQTLAGGGMGFKRVQEHKKEGKNPRCNALNLVNDGKDGNAALPFFQAKRKSGFQDGSGDQALFHSPMGLAVGDKRCIVVADTLNHSIRMIIMPLPNQHEKDDDEDEDEDENEDCKNEDEKVQVVTLTGREGVKGHLDGSCATARFHTPVGICFGPHGFQTIFVAEKGNNCLRQIVLPHSSQQNQNQRQRQHQRQHVDQHQQGWVRTILTDHPAPSRLFSNGKEPAFRHPHGICALNNGFGWYNHFHEPSETVLGVCDTGNHLIRVVSFTKTSLNESTSSKHEEAVVSTPHRVYRPFSRKDRKWMKSKCDALSMNQLSTHASDLKEGSKTVTQELEWLRSETADLRQENLQIKELLLTVTSQIKHLIDAMDNTEESLRFSTRTQFPPTNTELRQQSQGIKK